MDPGLRDKYVSIRRLETTIDAIGGVVKGWSHLAYVWGRMLPAVGREVVAAQTRISEASGVLRIGYRKDIRETWRVVVDGCLYEVAAPPVQVGDRGSYLDLVLKQAHAGNMEAPLSNVFEVSLPVGSTEKAVVFPAAFDAAPQGLYVQLVVPAGQESFTISTRDLTGAGFVVDLGAAVPASGYRLSVQAFRYQQTFMVDLVEGEVSQEVVFATAYPSKPRGLKATLMPPLPDGYDFTTALVVKSLTAAGFTLEYGATVPGPNYKALIQVSL